MRFTITVRSSVAGSVLLLERKLRYSPKLIVRSWLSGTRLNCLRPVMGTLAQALNSTSAMIEGRGKRMIVRVRWSIHGIHTEHFALTGVHDGLKGLFRAGGLRGGGRVRKWVRFDRCRWVRTVLFHDPVFSAR